VEIPWDLIDLTDTNGGLWPLPLDDFVHFCVIVRIAHADDVDECNNQAQNNFGDVGTVDSGDGDGVSRFLIGNPSRQACFIGLIPDHRIDRRWMARLDLSQLLEQNIAAMTELMKKRGSLPWLGNTPGAMVLPLRGGELRPVELHWSIKDREHYKGKVYGCLAARVGPLRKRTPVTGKLHGHIERLELAGDKFKASIVGRLVPSGRVGPNNPNVAVRGTLSGEVNRKTGKFKAVFAGVGASKGREKKLRFSAEGEMAASASFSFAVIGSDEDQGIDLAVPLVGKLRRVCDALSPKLRKSPKARKPRKRRQTKSKRR
jgi:hypothetical protein